VLPRVSVIVVHWNSARKAELINRHICSLRRVEYENFEVIMVDNGSFDNTYELLSGLTSNDPRFRLCRSPSNLFYAGGNNFGYNYVSEDSEYVFLVNPDTIVARDCFSKMVERLEQDSHVGIAQPYVGVYSPAYMTEDMVTIPITNTEYLGREFYPTLTSGALMVIRRNFLRKRGTIFHSVPLQYFDDDVLCIECWNQGWAVKYYPIIGGEHVGFAFSSSRIGVAHYNTARLLKLIKSNSKYRYAIGLIAGSGLLKNTLTGLVRLDRDHVFTSAYTLAKQLAEKINISLNIYAAPYIPISWSEFLKGQILLKSVVYNQKDLDPIYPKGIASLIK